MKGHIEIQEALLVGYIQSLESLLVGHIQSLESLHGHIRSCGSLVGSIHFPTGYINYNGDYEIIPKTESQVLDTADKHLSSNIKIREIPYYEVSNAYNGNTIIIGGDLIG